MFRPFLTLLSISALAACGGGSTSTVIPLEQSGFARTNSMIGTGQSFTIPDAIRITGEDGDIALVDQEIVLNILEGTPAVEVIIDGTPFLLESIGGGSYQFLDDGDQVAWFRRGTRFPEAEIVEIFAFIDGNLNASNLVIGFDTDPTEVVARGGTATMTGEILVTARNGFDAGFGEGDVTLTADFENNSVSGDFSVTDSGFSVADFVLSDATFRMNSGPISGNSFGGSISLTSGDPGGNLRDASYRGRFFGKDAPTAGGQIQARIEFEGSDSPTLVEGAFLATE